MAEPQVFHSRVTVNTEHGLHIRPCTILAQSAMKFQCQVRLVHGKQRVDAKSILDLMTLGAAAGTVLELETEGGDASEAIQQLTRLFEENFQLEPAPGSPAAAVG